MKTKLNDFLGIKYPIIQAPMAGGPTGSALVSSVSNNGGLGFIGAGFMSGEELNQLVSEVKVLTKAPFGVNLFIQKSFEDYTITQNTKDVLEDIANRLGASEPCYPEKVSSLLEDQLSVLMINPVAVISFTFGILDTRWIKELKKCGSKVMGTATSVEEAKVLELKDVDAVSAQGIEAGGHRGSFLADDKGRFAEVGNLSLIPQVVDAIHLPVIASGGISDGRAILAAMSLGAEGVQIGSAFLTTHEAQGLAQMKKRLVNSTDTSTVLTRSFTGKWARGIDNEFIREIQKSKIEIPPYPVMNQITSSIRNKAQEKGDTEKMSLWAGQSSSLSKRESVEEAFNRFVLEFKQSLKKLKQLQTT